MKRIIVLFLFILSSPMTANAQQPTPEEQIQALQQMYNKQNSEVLGLVVSINRLTAEKTRLELEIQKHGPQNAPATTK